MRYLRLISLLLLFTFSFLSVESAIEAKSGGVPFSFSNSPFCQVNPIYDQLIGSIKNISHIRAFFVMSLLGLIAFPKKKSLVTALFILSLTLITELLQMWSPSRHCKLTDLIPNFIGFALALFLYRGIHLIKKVSKPD